MASLNVTPCQAAEEQENWEIFSIGETLPESDHSTESGGDSGPEAECASSDDEREQDRPPAVGPVAFSPEETLLVFDWDDTLLPTTWLEREGLLLCDEAVASEEQRAQLQALADRAAATLAEAQRHGTVVIVTNASEGWVEDSCERFLPSLAPALRRLRIVSARAKYEKRGIRCPTAWKTMAFEWEVELFFGGFAEGARKNILSIGDSVHEHMALISASRDLPGCRAKSLKLKERPSPEQLAEEQVLVEGTLEELVQHDGDLDVDVSDAL